MVWPCISIDKFFCVWMIIENLVWNWFTICIFSLFIWTLQENNNVNQLSANVTACDVNSDVKCRQVTACDVNSDVKWHQVTPLDVKWRIVTMVFGSSSGSSEHSSDDPNRVGRYRHPSVPPSIPPSIVASSRGSKSPDGSKENEWIMSKKDYSLPG